MSVYNATANVSNCTFTGNMSGSDFHEVAFKGTLNAVNTVFWDDGVQYIFNNGTLNLYHCAYGINAIGGTGTVGGDGAHVENLDWSRRISKGVIVSEDVEVEGVHHKVFPLEWDNEQDRKLIGRGLTPDGVVEALKLTSETNPTAAFVKDLLSRDQLGHTRNSVPDIGAWEYVSVEGVKLNGDTEALTVGGTAELSVDIAPEDAMDKNVTWSTSDGDIAMVDQTGKVTAVAAGGPVTITAASVESANINATRQVTVSKGTPKVTAPTAKTDLKYNGTAQALVNAGTTTGGTLVYSLAKDKGYSADIPTGKDAGEYTVYYMVSGDVNYNSTDPAGPVKVTIVKADDTSKTDPVTPDPVNPSDELTEAEKAAQEEAKKQQEQETNQKADEAEKAAKTVDTTTEGGQALADLLSGKTPGDNSKTPEEQKQTQAAALEVREALEKSGTDLSTLTAHDIEMAVKNKEQERKAAIDEEVRKEVSDPKVPAATDLLTKYGSNETLNKANEKLSVQPKLVQPEVLSEDSAKKMASDLGNVRKEDVDSDVNYDAVQAAAQPGAIKSSDDITIVPASRDLKEQAEAVEKVFNELSADLAGANEGKGVVIATVLPKMTPKVSGFFPLRVTLRHLLPDPGRRLRFWPSVSYFQRQARGEVSVSVASGKEGDYFFLDENNVPTAVVSGDASKMTVVPYLTAGREYSDVFITVDATTSDDQKALKDLKEAANGGGNSPTGSDTPDSPTSNKGNGGCDAGLGSLALLALVGLIATKKH